MSDRSISRCCLRTFLTMYIVDGKEFFVVECVDEDEDFYIIKRLNLKPRPGEYVIMEVDCRYKVGPKIGQVLDNWEDYFNENSVVTIPEV